MSVAFWALLAAVSWADRTDPGSLVEQLGASRYAQREAAASALKKLGADALPALRQALDSKDPEIRNRAQSLIDTIDSDLLIRPTLVKMDFEKEPVNDVASSVSAQSGIKILLEPLDHPMWKSRTLSLHEAEPVPFWKAIDLLSQAGGLVPNPSAQMMGEVGRAPVLRMFAGETAALPTSDSGPFRITLVSVHHHRDLMLSHGAPGVAQPIGGGIVRQPPNGQVPPPPLPAQQRFANDQFYAQMQVMVEPRLMLVQSHDLKLEEAVDDKDQSLLLPTSGGQAQRFSAYYGINPGGALQFPVHLKYPEQPGKTIKKFKGVLPVTVSARKSDPLVIPLESENLNKEFHNADVQLTLTDLKTGPNVPRATIGVSVKMLARQGDAGQDGDPGMPPFGRAFRMPTGGQSQIEILDEKGNPLQGFTSSPNATRGQTEEGKFTITLLPGASGPAELRYYSLARATTDVPFEFTNVPMP
jgi:hypothetical protein